jgi:hypothetical protein
MKDYPSIPASTGNKFREMDSCYVFDKLDGSSMRSEWSKKRGWYKHGKRKGLIDHSNPHLLEVPELFERTLAEDLARLARDNHWQHMVVFYEFWGDQSVAGLHFEGDPKRLTLFDAAVDKKGILPPREFLKRFDNYVPTATFLGRYHWSRDFVQRVRRGEVEGVTFEGVVGKAADGPHRIVRSKAKTQAWIDKVLEIHGKDAGEKLVNS